MASSSSFYQNIALEPVGVQYSLDQILAVLTSAIPSSILSALGTLPTYNGSGPIPVQSGQWFISNGVLTQAQ